MSRSTDPGHFFQTDASEAARSRRAAKAGNKNGNPIALQSKILDVIADPSSDALVYVAESAGCIRKINIENGQKIEVYKGPTAPLTSVTLGGKGGNMVFAGCWDKDIWYWHLKISAVSGRFKGHSDFVKSVVCARVSGKDILISGGADAKIIVWDTVTGTKLHVLQDNKDLMRAIQFLAIDPIGSTDDGIVFFSSSSDPLIRHWRISLGSANQIFEKADSEPGQVVSLSSTIREHETSVYKLFFDLEEGDLWTASADGTIKCLSRERNWEVEETIEHGDYVRAVVVTADWIVTAGRSEDVKVWDRSTGKLFHIFDGHFEEVTGLALVNNCTKVVSVSIDGTIRSWPLSRNALDKAKMDKEEKINDLVKETVDIGKPLMTEEEEAELAELMEDDDE